jgi:hypothetical protein
MPTISDPSAQEAASTAMTSAVDRSTPTGSISQCAWAVSSIGCQMRAIVPKDECNRQGCSSLLHHNCQTEWEMHQYKSECPDGDPSECKYDSGGLKFCMKHHPFSAVAIANCEPDIEFISRHEDTETEEDVSPTKSHRAPNSSKKAKSSKAPKLTQEQKAEKKKQRLNWASALTIDTITLTEGGDDVLLLASLEWSDKTKVSKEMMKLAFMRKNNITVPNAMRNDADLGKLVANHIKAQGYKDGLIDNLKKKKKKSSDIVKPGCLQKEGTIFKVANTLLKNKECFMELHDANDRHEQDTRNPKPVAWDTLHLDYSSGEDPELELLSPLARNEMIGHQVPADVCKDSDEVNRPGIASKASSGTTGK